MKKEHKFIFDMDGTLYHFDKGKSQAFTSSRFYSDLKLNIHKFFMDNQKLDQKEAIVEYERIKQKYNGEVSLGVEIEYGINRYDYFQNTWNLKPEKYIDKDKDLPKLLENIKGRIALLTAAPKIWAINVLAHLDLKTMFENRMYTGESDIRKPNPSIFKKISEDFGVKPENIFSIGDQENSDIVPAKNIGMKTILIGKSQNTASDYQFDNIKQALDVLQQDGYF